MKKRLLSLIIMALLALSAHAEPPADPGPHTRDAVRAAYHDISADSSGSPYMELPAISSPYAAGELTGEARAGALATLNFIRWLAGLEPVKQSEIYDYQCQHAAVLLAALDYVDHNATRPEDMDKNFYDSAHTGTASGNIARFNWMRDTIIREGVTYFVRDDGDANLDVLGHRRWALNPAMAATGFGLANSASGMSYVVMYAHDLGNPDAGWKSVRWPSAGAFPAELMHDHLAWSVTLNPEVYDLAASMPRITLAEDGLGLRFEFDLRSGTGDGRCALNREPYGAGPCLIFRPDFEGTGFTDYAQNQSWRVRIDGLVTVDGTETCEAYTTEMISLAVQDAVNIEISRPEAALSAGDTLRLSAAVVPTYADDVSVRWMSTDVSVATVDADGLVTAVAPGECEIVCENCAGHQDACALTVFG